MTRDARRRKNPHMRAKKMRRGVVTLLVALSMSLALPALAVVSKSGSINCTPNNMAVKSYAVGHVHHYAPLGSQIGNFNNSTWQSRTTTTFLQSASWKVTSTGSLSSPLTNGICWGS